MFLVPKGWKPGDPTLLKFLVFFDDIQDSIAAAKALQMCLPHAHQAKIAWFNSDMMTDYKETQVTHLCISTNQPF